MSPRCPPALCGRQFERNSSTSGIGGFSWRDPERPGRTAEESLEVHSQVQHGESHDLLRAAAPVRSRVEPRDRQQRRAEAQNGIDRLIEAKARNRFITALRPNERLSEAATCPPPDRRATQCKTSAREIDSYRSSLDYGPGSATGSLQ